jgi:uncharacterized membrane protein YdbT with pleckstrin-like domain
MAEGLRKLVLRVLKVPPKPQMPAGSQASVRVFRAAKRFYHLNLIRWFFRQLATLAGILFAVGALQTGGFGISSVLDEVFHQGVTMTVLEVLELVGIGLFVAQLPFSLYLVKLDYDMRWYIVTDRSVRIREGVWKVSEMTLTFANVQEVSIRQGPIQRLLGISDLRVRNAGGGNAAAGGRQGEHDKADSHTGYFRGVDNSEEIRDLVLDRLRKLKDAGLGDPDQAAAARESASPAGADLLAAADEVLAAAVGLHNIGRS